jgi:glucose-6-phosphate dehydrogenase assembly protein OpcA
MEADLSPAAGNAVAGLEYPERTRWVGKGVGAEDIHAELDRLHRAAGGPGRVLALARTLNLIVVPCSDRHESQVESALDRLGSHTPSRTLVLREHGEDRLDASLVMECATPAGAGEVGLCHDRVLLTLNEARLEHSASLLAPLLVSDLPTVLWLPEPRSAIPDPALLERAQYVLVDSGAGAQVMLGRLAELAAAIRVHDLAWGRLEYWRAATAAAFEPLERRRLLPTIRQVELRYEPMGLGAGLLLAGWLAARAGWRPGPLERSNGTARVHAVRPDGAPVSLELAESGADRGCGGVDALTFRAAEGEVEVSRGGATSSLRDLFAEALQPQPAFARGYAPAVSAAAKMLDGSP